MTGSVISPSGGYLKVDVGPQHTSIMFLFSPGNLPGARRRIKTRKPIRV